MKKPKFLVFAWVLMICAVFLTILDVSCFDRSFYIKEYEKNATAQVIQISDEDLMRVTDHLLDYIQDKEEVLSISAEIAGVERNVFDERDTAHMVDVKALYLNAMTFRNITFVLSFVLFAWNALNLKKEFIVSLGVSFYKALGIFMTICIAVIVGAAIDFDSLWRLFHRIFFTNDLWLLDPNVSVLINMVPLQFFFDLVAKIVVMFIGFLAVTSTVFLVVLKKVINQ
ncbi:MAG: TIGR01906 family membrane protein [Erysipelotrichaceae bacterium]|nr:TIGR01906 family membrane protein [Erysipelotrichaceae bacterium]